MATQVVAQVTNEDGSISELLIDGKILKFITLQGATQEGLVQIDGDKIELTSTDGQEDLLIETNNPAQALALSSTYHNYGNGYDVATAKLAEGIVVLGGLIQANSNIMNLGDVVLTLPANMRPKAEQIFLQQSGGGALRVNISADGSIMVGADGGGDWLSLAGISFAVA